MKLCCSEIIFTEYFSLFKKYVHLIICSLLKFSHYHKDYEIKAVEKHVLIKMNHALDSSNEGIQFAIYPSKFHYSKPTTLLKKKNTKIEEQTSNF